MDSKSKPKVFLGGTVNGSKWRDYMMPLLRIDFFNPVVDNWTEAAYEEELRERKNSDFCLYVITPLMTGVYAIAEVVDDSNKRPEKTLFCFLDKDQEVEFTSHQKRAMKKVGAMVADNGAKAFENLDDLVTFLNNVRK